MNGYAAPDKIIDMPDEYAAKHMISAYGKWEKHLSARDP
jgi:hypothetical protein